MGREALTMKPPLCTGCIGNIYVTGSSEGPGTLWDYATVNMIPMESTVGSALCRYGWLL